MPPINFSTGMISHAYSTAVYKTVPTGIRADIYIGVNPATNNVLGAREVRMGLMFKAPKDLRFYLRSLRGKIAA